MLSYRNILISMILTLTVILTVTYFASSASTQMSFNNHYYVYYKNREYWQDVSANCKKSGGYLISINSVEEFTELNGFIDRVTRVPQLWIGLKVLCDNTNCSQYRWEDGTTPTVINWEEDYPKHNLYAYYVVMDRTTKKWRNTRSKKVTGGSSTKQVYICEFNDACFPKVPVNTTPGSLCGRNQRCVSDKWHSFNCSCLPGYKEPTCRRKLYCFSNPCEHGTCEERQFYYYCNCADTIYKGQQCGTVKPQCKRNKCAHGSCLEDKNQFMCICTNTGYEGTTCDREIDECQSNPCGAGTCVDGPNNYYCLCQPGYHGRSCAFDINECSTLDKACNEHGNCTNAIGNYSCECEATYIGDYCERQLLPLSAVQESSVGSIVLAAGSMVVAVALAASVAIGVVSLHKERVLVMWRSAVGILRHHQLRLQTQIGNQLSTRFGTRFSNLFGNRFGNLFGTRVHVKECLDDDDE